MWSPPSILSAPPPPDKRSSPPKPFNILASESPVIVSLPVFEPVIFSILFNISFSSVGVKAVILEEAILTSESFKLARILF